jgi:hypothetical protein
LTQPSGSHPVHTVARPKKASPKPSVPLKQFNWAKISDAKTLDTIWEKISDDHVKVNQKELEQFFASAQKKGNSLLQVRHIHHQISSLDLFLYANVQRLLQVRVAKLRQHQQQEARKVRPKLQQRRIYPC